MKSLNVLTRKGYWIALVMLVAVVIVSTIGVRAYIGDFERFLTFAPLVSVGFTIGLFLIMLVRLRTLDRGVAIAFVAWAPLLINTAVDSATKYEVTLPSIVEFTILTALIVVLGVVVWLGMVTE